MNVSIESLFITLYDCAKVIRGKSDLVLRARSTTQFRRQLVVHILHVVFNALAFMSSHLLPHLNERWRKKKSFQIKLFQVEEGMRNRGAAGS